MEFAVIYLASIQISWMDHSFGVISIVSLLNNRIKEVCKHLPVKVRSELFQI